MNNTANRRKHQRFIKRLTTTFFVDNSRFTGISSDISSNGLFIRTSRGFPANTLINIEILLPNNEVSVLKGIVRRTLRTSISSKKNGMGIEIIEMDALFKDFLKSLTGRNEANPEENVTLPESQTGSCINDGIEQHGFKHPAQERRKHKRLQTGHLNLMSEMPSAREVTIINISMSGVLIKTDRRFNIGQTYVIKIGYKEKKVFMKAAVAWACLLQSTEDAPGNMTPFYIAGMQFIETVNKTLEDIINSINLDGEESVVQLHTPGTTLGNIPRPTHENLSAKKSSKETCRILSDKKNAPSANKPYLSSQTDCIKEIEDTYAQYEKNNLTYYEVLNISNYADMQEIKRAYYKRAGEFHPDRHYHLTFNMKEKLNTLAAHLNEAYEILMNPRQKAEYDQRLLSKVTTAVSNKELAHQEFERGKIEFWNGNLATAEMSFQKSLYFDNSSGKYFYFYAKTLLKTGKLHEAEKAIKEAIRIDTSNADYFIEAGYIYQAINLFYRARENFETALKIDPSNIKAREAIAGLRSKNGINGIRDSLYNPIKALKKTLVG
jgi:curved DNA-binding protein CbpA/Tfp pilus assembly protein PilZ